MYFKITFLITGWGRQIVSPHPTNSLLMAVVIKLMGNELLILRVLEIVAAIMLVDGNQ